MIKPILFIALILVCFYFMYWMIREGENVRDQYERSDIIEDDYV